MNLISIIIVITLIFRIKTFSNCMYPLTLTAFLNYVFVVKNYFITLLYSRLLQLLQVSNRVEMFCIIYVLQANLNSCIIKIRGSNIFISIQTLNFNSLHNIRSKFMSYFLSQLKFYNIFFRLKQFVFKLKLSIFEQLHTVCV